MHALRTIIAQGLTFGSIYAIAAIGFGLIYNTTRAFHIAYGAIGVAGSYVVVTLAANGPLTKLMWSTLLAIAVAYAITVFVFAFLYRPVQNREGGRLAVFVISLGVTFAVEPIITLWRGAGTRSFGFSSYLRLRDIAGLPISYLAIAVVVMGVLAIVGLQLALKHTNWGFELQGLASNPELAELVGTRKVRVIGLMLLIASGLGTIAALLLGMYTVVTPSGGTSLALLASVAVIAGGVGSYTGAYLLALVLGVLQAVMSYVLPGAWTTVGVYAAVLLLILLRPTGVGRGWVTSAV
jgi:branched-subunit amino acid ABC-type transport system permease component